MITFTRDELNTLGACLNFVVQRDGIQAAKALIPLFEKIEAMAAEMDKTKADTLEIE